MPSLRGLSCPVIVAASVDLERRYDDTSLSDLLAMSDEPLAAIDPLAMNLIVANSYAPVPRRDSQASSPICAMFIFGTIDRSFACNGRMSSELEAIT
jgi:hypothetical protein